MKTLLMSILVISGLLGACTQPQPKSDEANAERVEGFAPAFSGLRAPIDQTLSAVAIFGTALAVCVRDGGQISIPTSPVELW